MIEGKIGKYIRIINQFYKKKRERERDWFQENRRNDEGKTGGVERSKKRRGRRRGRQGWVDVESSCRSGSLTECFTEGDGASNFNNWM